MQAWWKTVSSRLERLPLFALLAAAHQPLFFLAVDHRYEALPALWLPLLAFSAAGAIALLVAAAIYRNWLHAGLAVFLTVAALFLFNPLMFGTVRIMSGNPTAVAVSVAAVSLGFLALFVVGLLLIRKINGTLLRDTTYLLNITMIVIVLWDIATLSFYYGSVHARLSQGVQYFSDNKPVSRISPIRQKPDIYYIVLDGFASQDTLSDIYKVDDSFIGELRKRGFYVATKSQSNYMHTLLSLMSSLNMRYVDAIPEDIEKGNNWNNLYPFLQNNRVASLLRSDGYRYVLIDSGCTESRRSAIADVVYSYPAYNSLVRRTVLETPWLFVENFVPALHRLNRELIHWEFGTLKSSASLPGPKFVFAHINLPHFPYLFNADGSPRNCNLIPHLENWTDYPGYRNSVLYTERNVLDIVDWIVAHSAQRPVIILQGDHGSDSKGNLRSGSPNPAYLHERFGILNAYLLPDPAPVSLYASITPVNSFRLILREYLGLDLPQIEDRNFFSSFDQMLHVQDVTQLTKPKTDELPKVAQP